MCVFGRMLFEYWLLNFEFQFWMSACSLWGNCQLAKKEVEVELLKRCDGSRHRASLTSKQLPHNIHNLDLNKAEYGS
jgi:hypothetical protein